MMSLTITSENGNTVESLLYVYPKYRQVVTKAPLKGGKRKRVAEQQLPRSARMPLYSQPSTPLHYFIIFLRFPGNITM